MPSHFKMVILQCPNCNNIFERKWKKTHLNPSYNNSFFTTCSNKCGREISIKVKQLGKTHKDILNLRENNVIKEYEKRNIRSIINKISKEELQDIVNKSSSYKDVLNFLGLKHHGGNGYTLKKRLQEDSIDITELQNRRKSNTKNRLFTATKANIPLDELLVEKSKVTRYHIKSRLISEGILNNKCYNCGMDPFWDNKPLVLVLDHINGINDDYRKENLRLLCPNCNNQTDTFAGRNLKNKNFCSCGTKIPNSKVNCKKCLKEIKKREKVEKTIQLKDTKLSPLKVSVPIKPNWRNRPRPHTRKVPNRPSLETLLQNVKDLGYVKTGKLYGVSDNAIRKWIKWYMGQKVEPKTI